MRTLGIDFGETRIGLAISDPAGRVAVPLTTLERLVLGEPVGLDGQRGPAAERVERFGRKLAAVTGLPLALIDEALTTVAAAERLREAGIDPRRQPERLDALAAQILLQDALDRGNLSPDS